MRLPAAETVASPCERRAGITLGTPGRKESDCMKFKLYDYDNDRSTDIELSLIHI